MSMNLFEWLAVSIIYTSRKIILLCHRSEMCYGTSETSHSRLADEPPDLSVRRERRGHELSK